MVRSGIISVIATTRGTTRYWIGETAMVESASICSVTFMVPSSVAIAEPARPVTISAVKTGASSRQSEITTVAPTSDSALNFANANEDCSANTRPAKVPVRSTMNSEPTPMNSHCWSKRRSR